MKIQNFLNYNKRCVLCNCPMSFIMLGDMREKIGSFLMISKIQGMVPVQRKDFFTFGIVDARILTKISEVDFDTFDVNKYETFTIDKDNFVKFDKIFHYKMSISFQGICPKYSHYGYTSRRIKISDTSPDITRGFPCQVEELALDKYLLKSDKKEQKTLIITAGQENKEPFQIPYKEISDFPYDDKEKFVKRIENILLLG